MTSDGGVPQAMKRLAPAPRNAALSAGQRVGDDMVAQARGRAPRLTGRLAASIRRVVRKTPTGVEVVVEAGAGLDYAMRQHEDFTIQHDEGGPKFVEIPFVRLAPDFRDQVQDDVDKEAARA